MNVPRRGRSLLLLATVVIVSAAVVSGGAASAGAATPAPTAATAQLQGSFLMAGHITLARGVVGERAGQNVQRAWTFQPGCSTGGCKTIGLIRQRAGGTDRLLLVRRPRGVYTVLAKYYAPLRCGGRTYPTGEAVVFRITVTITATAISGGQNMATGISAAYASFSRANLTRCVGVAGRDAATYRGQPLAVPGQI
ncbi:MAG: hypothetical protein ACR2JH_04415 [Solirubrobacteraceae bacterium]